MSLSVDLCLPSATLHEVLELRISQESTRLEEILATEPRNSKAQVTNHLIFPSGTSQALWSPSDSTLVGRWVYSSIGTQF